MTGPHYLSSCAGESQDRGDASPSAYAWAVNFNNGNANNYHRDNDCRVRAVRGSSREFQGVELSALHAAWQQARRGKVPSHDQLAFETCWADRLLELQAQLNEGTWQPLPSTCFVATRPKAREIHAPAFADRVVHHWLVPQLEAVFEPGFIHDSYANRTGKGSHAAVRRLGDFVRQVYSGQGGGWFLQLDIANFFNRISRPTLWAILKPRLQRAGVSHAAQSVTHALLRRSAIDIGVQQRCTAAELAQVPPHKQLRNAPRGCGIAIGNLSSQFFANVYLDRLDQFAKHTLRARRYLRYVDDFVLLHRDRDQLLEWRGQIEQFLRAELRLELKAEQHLAPLHQGIDFLGYIVHPTHTTVRRRVLGHCRSALAGWETMHVRDGRIHATPQDLQQLRAIAASYAGHFAHADHHRLTHALAVRFPWLATATRPRRHRFEAMAKPLKIPYRKPS
jgi:RNA-directed DNA polymerase